MGSSIQDTSVQIFDPDEQKNYSVNIPKSEMYLLNDPMYLQCRLVLKKKEYGEIREDVRFNLNLKDPETTAVFTILVTPEEYITAATNLKFAQELIEKAKYAVENHLSNIPGTSGEKPFKDLSNIPGTSGEKPFKDLSNIPGTSGDNSEEIFIKNILQDYENFKNEESDKATKYKNLGSENCSKTKKTKSASTKNSKTKKAENNSSTEWSDDENKTLIANYKNYKSLLNSNVKVFYNKIREALQAKGSSKQASECKTQMDKLKDAYKGVIDNQRRKTGTGHKTCDYFDELHELFFEKPYITPKALAGKNFQMNINGPEDANTSGSSASKRLKLTEEYLEMKKEMMEDTKQYRRDKLAAFKELANKLSK